MTQEVRPVTRGAQELHKKLQEMGSINKQEVRDWLAEIDPELTPSTINAVIGHGMDSKKRWWHEDSEGFLVDGPKEGIKPSKSSEEDPGEVPASISDEVKKPTFLDPSTVSEPRDQFYTIALNMGIPEKAARTTAYNCWGVADMFNPAEAWQAIVQGSDLMPTQKKRLWRNWCSWGGIKISEGLIEKVEAQYVTLSNAERAKASGVALAPARRFIPVKGEVVMVEPDDPGGMSFSEALMSADRQQKLQAESPLKSQNDNAVVVALIHEAGENQRASGENQRALVELLKPADSGAANSTLEIVKLMIDGVKESSANAMALMKQDLDHRLENEARDRKAAEERSNAILLKLTEVIDRQGQSKNPFDMMDQVLPGFGAKMLENILNPPRKENEFMVSLGDQGKMSLDDYERYSAIQSKREVVQMARQRLPELFQLGRDLLTATNRATGRDRQEQPILHQPVSQKDAGYDGYCVACLRVVKLPERGEEFTCPYPDCRALQSLAGEVMATGKAEYPAERLGTMDEGADGQLVREQDDLVDREHLSDFVAPQPPARESTEEPVTASGVPNAG